MATVIEIEVRTDQAERRILDLEKALEKMKNGAQKASQDGLERLTKNGGAMGILNDLTGGLAMGFKDAYESIQLSNTGLKGMKAALLSTGIGALVVAVGAIAANWEDISKWIKTSTTGLEAYQSIAEGIREITKGQLDYLTKTENSLKLQGLSEEEIINKKMSAIELDKGALSFSIALNEMELARLELIEDENKARIEGLGIFGKVLGLKYEEQEQTTTSRENLKAQKAELLELESVYDGLQLSLNGLKDAEEQKRQQQAEAATAANAAALKEREKDEIESMQRITQAQRDELALRNEQAAEAEHEAGVARLETIDISNEQIAASNKKMRDESLKNEETLSNAKKSLATSTFGFLQTLAEVFGKGNDKRARTAFQVSKALSLAEATANTWSSVTAVLKDPTYIGPSRFIAAASAGLIGLSSIAKIASTQFNSGGGGGGSVGGSAPSVDSGSVPQGQSPQAAIDFSFLQQQPPLQTYVIGSEVKTANEATQKIKDQSTL